MIRWRWSANVSRSGQSGPVPERLGQRLGGDHQRVHRHQGALLAPQGPGVALGGPDHGGRPHRAPVGVHRPGPDGPGLGPLVDGHAPPLHGLGQSPHQPGRVHGGAVGGVGAAQHGGGPHHGRRLGRRQQPEVVLADARRPGPRPPRAGPARAGPRSGPAPPSPRGRSRTRCPRRRPPVPPRRRCPPWPGAWPLPTRGRATWSSFASGTANSAEHQPPFRPEAPKPTTSRSSDGDAQGRVGLGQVVGGPQAGEASAHHGHVHVDVAGQAGAGRSMGLGEPVPPQGEPSVVLARGRAQICFHASVSTERRMEVITSNSSSPQVRGGASWITGSPRSSARQIRPAS